MLKAVALLITGLLAFPSPALAEEKCRLEPLLPEQSTGNPWIGRQNWLAPENLRYGAANIFKFMPTVQITSRAPATAPRKSDDRVLDLQSVSAIDPIDGKSRSLSFLLSARVYADGVLVMRNGAIIYEEYRNGLTEVQPRLIGPGTRPVLAMLAAISSAKGKLRLEHALSRHLPELASAGDLRKISLLRLLNSPDAFRWSGDDLLNWNQAGGWNQERASGDIKAWAKSAPWRLASSRQPGTLDGPEGQLVAWAVERAWNQPVTKVFCEKLFGPSGAEHSAYWATDSQGTPLVDGLALSLRDFARLGALLIDSQGNYRGALPSWFADGVAAGGPGSKSPALYLAGFGNGTQGRYGFIGLPGQSRRAAAIGTHGTSLFVDFDKLLVVAILASYPAERSPLMFQTLNQVWQAIGAAGAKAPQQAISYKSAPHAAWPGGTPAKGR